jgi:hypothetical protein
MPDPNLRPINSSEVLLPVCRAGTLQRFHGDGSCNGRRRKAFGHARMNRLRMDTPESGRQRRIRNVRAEIAGALSLLKDLLDTSSSSFRLQITIKFIARSASRGAELIALSTKGCSVMLHKSLLATFCVVVLPLASAQAQLRIGIGIGLPVFAPAPCYGSYYGPYYRPYYSPYYYPYAPAYVAARPAYIDMPPDFVPPPQYLAPGYAQPIQAPVYSMPQGQPYAQPVPQAAPSQPRDVLPPPTPVPDK